MPDENKEEKRVKISVVEETSEEIPIEKNSEDLKESVVEEIKSETESEKKEVLFKKPETEKPKDPVNQSDRIPFWVLFFSFLVGLSLGAGLIGGLFYYKSKVSKSETAAIPTQSPPLTSEIINNPEASASASPLSKAEISKYTVQILNGSGISGEATKVEPLLKAIGFTNIKTANASRFDYKETEISIKKGVDVNVVELIKSALKGYTVKEIETPSPTYDLLIVVGSKKK